MQGVIGKFNLQPLENIPLHEVITELSKSVSGRYLLEANVRISYDAHNACACLYRKQNIITLPTHRSLPELMVLLTVQLKKFHQPALDPLKFEPDDAILVNRLIAFDALTFAVRVAYELALSKSPEMWLWMYVNCKTGPLRTYELGAQKDLRKLNTGEIHRQCYDEMFKETILVDKGIIKHMLFDEYLKSTTWPKLTNNELQKFGQLPNGVNYLGRNSKDDKYHFIENRSNANFLWFVKFERSFAAKERTIQQELPEKLSAQIIQFRTAK